VSDSEDFDEFYYGSFNRLLRYAHGLTGDLGDAEDLVQEVYTRAWLRWRKLKEYDEPEGWLRVVVTRLATDRWRRLVVRRAAIHDPSSTVVLPPHTEEHLVLAEAMRSLPFDQRRALVLRFLLDLPLEQIAKEMDANLNTVKSWLTRGKANLAAIMAEKGEIHV
jgi:RNA polymerase sigma-70 factor (ECF subfamily)